MIGFPAKVFVSALAGQAPVHGYSNPLHPGAAFDLRHNLECHLNCDPEYILLGSESRISDLGSTGIPLVSSAFLTNHGMPRVTNEARASQEHPTTTGRSDPALYALSGAGILDITICFSLNLFCRSALVTSTAPHQAFAQKLIRYHSNTTVVAADSRAKQWLDNLAAPHFFLNLQDEGRLPAQVSDLQDWHHRRAKALAV